VTARYLLDTNVVSYSLKGSSAVLDRNLAGVPPAEVAISVVTEAELRFGLARLPQASRWIGLVESLLLRVAILPWASDSAKEYARLRATLERTGKRMRNLDLMIASQALALGLTLVTHDQAFGRIETLKIEDWIA
jgi:tRNA(fMet)-specific endonuclease VapC